MHHQFAGKFQAYDVCQCLKNNYRFKGLRHPAMLTKKWPRHNRIFPAFPKISRGRAPDPTHKKISPHKAFKSSGLAGPEQ